MSIVPMTSTPKAFYYFIAFKYFFLFYILFFKLDYSTDFSLHGGSLWNVSGSIQKCQLRSEIMHEEAPEIFGQQWKLESRHNHDLINIGKTYNPATNPSKHAVFLVNGESNIATLYLLNTHEDTCVDRCKIILFSVGIRAWSYAKKYLHKHHYQTEITQKAILWGVNLIYFH